MKNTQLQRKLTIQQKVNRAYNSLGKRWKKQLQGDKDNILRLLAYDLKSQNIQTSPRTILRKMAETLERQTGEGTLRWVYSRFRNEESAVYAKYNSYMYRRGYSASQYFYGTASVKQQGSIIEVTVGLPKGGKIQYNLLYIQYDFSGDYLEATIY